MWLYAKVPYSPIHSKDRKATIVALPDHGVTGRAACMEIVVRLRDFSG